MNEREASKRLAYVLRHRPDSIGVELDAQGWVGVERLLAGLAEHGFPLSEPLLRRIVQRDDKGRYTFSADGAHVRALQGHSVDVALTYPVVEPPAVLFHGTVPRFVPSIRAQGLHSGARHHVHLSADIETAVVVARRRGEPVVFEVDARGLVDSGAEFMRTPNGVWLVAAVPPSFLRVIARSE